MLNKEEREVLTKNAVRDVGWAAATEEERSEMVNLDLWKAKLILKTILIQNLQLNFKPI